jgi:hypothetical protein
MREMKVKFAPYSAVRRDNGRTLVCGQKSVVEIDRADAITWSLEGAEIPEMGIRWFAGLQALPDGNVLVCNAGGKVAFLEISRQKRIVWDSGAQRQFPSGHGIQRLDIPGPALK